MGLVVMVVVPGAAAGQSAPTADPAQLLATVSVPVGTPPELSVQSFSAQPTASGGRTITFGFAGDVAAPATRWRLSVGLGDPAGPWQRASMVWDGQQGTGRVELIDGLAATELGAVAVQVDATGVAIELPADLVASAPGKAIWVEGVLGEDGAPSASMRSAWFPVDDLFGSTTVGAVAGGRLGIAVPLTGVRTVFDTGEPSSVTLENGTATVVIGGPAPGTVAGDAVANAVDLVSFADPAGSLSSAAQLRIDLSSGSVELTSGPVLGPLGNTVQGPVVPSDPSWLLQGPDDTVAGSEVIVDLEGAFAALGQPSTNGPLAVTVSRVLSVGDGAVVAAGVSSNRQWLDRPASSPQGDEIRTAALPVDSEDDPMPYIATGVGAGLLLVVVAVLISGLLARRRGADADRPSATVPVAATSVETATSAGFGPRESEPEMEPLPVLLPEQMPKFEPEPPLPVLQSEPEPSPASPPPSWPVDDDMLLIEPARVPLLEASPADAESMAPSPVVVTPPAPEPMDPQPETHPSAPDLVVPEPEPVPEVPEPEPVPEVPEPEPVPEVPEPEPVPVMPVPEPVVPAPEPVPVVPEPEPEPGPPVPMPPPVPPAAGVSPTTPPPVQRIKPVAPTVVPASAATPGRPKFARPTEDELVVVAEVTEPEPEEPARHALDLPEVSALDNDIDALQERLRRLRSGE
jgi:hypothetical protein